MPRYLMQATLCTAIEDLKELSIIIEEIQSDHYRKD